MYIFTYSYEQTVGRWSTQRPIEQKLLKHGSIGHRNFDFGRVLPLIRRCQYMRASRVQFRWTMLAICV